MLAKAVQQHDASVLPPCKPPATLAQQLFPSSSPTGSQSLKKSPFHKPQLPSNALRPSTSSTVNGKLGYNNPLKRTASQANGMGSYSSRPDSRSSASTRTSVFDKASVIDLTQSSLLPGGSIVGKLHEAVYFDENDFVDDADLDLDADDDVVQVSQTRPISYPSLPSLDAAPASSVPLRWSSSPLQHKAALVEDGSLYPDLNHVETRSREGVMRPTKRRTLPWMATEDQRENTSEAPTGTKPTKAAYTPLPKDKSSQSPFPWNKTASVVKEEQKKLRQQANQVKKAVKTVDGVDDEQIDSVKKARANRNSVARVFLSDEQRKVLNLVVDEKKSVFFTGSAGTGKSVLMREIIAVLRRNYAREPDRVAVTASTGLAACNIGGVTLHSFGGIGLGKEDVPTLVKKIKRNQKAKLRWMRTKVLIVDEISMVDGDLFDKLEAIARSIRSNGRPFGGIQLVITGDFFQLPPVPDYGKVAKFAFDAATWNTSINHTIGLTQVFRQRDPVFANMLNEMRLGKLSQKSIATFHSLSRKLNFQDDFEATELFPTRQEVDAANNMRMRNLGGSAVTFDALDGGSIQDIAQRDKLLSNCMAPASITLKKGAQVMLIKNTDDTLVNGSLGKVIGFMDEKTFDYYHDNEDEFQSIETQDDDGEDLSRGKQKLKALMNTDLVGSTSKKWPLVRFHIADGSSRDLLCQRESWKIELPNGEVQASREQIPLILAWALSIHKAQGQTLERVKVDLGKIFEKGQAYVALSRATCQEGLQISRFDPKKVMAHDKVRLFYDSLYSIDRAVSSSEQMPKVAERKMAKDYEQNYIMGPESFEEDEDALRQAYG